MAEFDLKPLNIDLPHTAFRLFREWTNKVHKKFPNINLIIQDEKKLEEDLENSIIQALEELRKTDLNRKESGWDIGFFWGFVQSNLNHHWYHEYIQKQSNQYKIISMLQSIRLNIRNNPNVSEIIQKNYENQFLKECNLKDIDSTISITKEVILKNLMFQNMYIPNIESQNNLEKCLDNVIIDLIDNMLEQKIPIYLPELDAFMNSNNVKNLILINIKK
ncbi:MAG: hypothetical protein JXR70_15490 [Spirochaetales bacterium]|nr:hypothetical protein [Spirochaetales bacterium]